MSGFKMVIYFHDNILERHCTPFNIPCAANFLTAFYLTDMQVLTSFLPLNFLIECSVTVSTHQFKIQNCFMGFR